MGHGVFKCGKRNSKMMLSKLIFHMFNFINLKFDLMGDNID